MLLRIAVVCALLIAAIAGGGASAAADTPDPPVAAAFPAPLCPGETIFEPTENTGSAVLDLTQVFGARLTAYNEGRVVPLYDAYGSSVLLTDEGVVEGGAAYPPLCTTRYVESLGAAVSEWAFCTDIGSQSCGDTNAAGELVDHEGNPINPMTALEGNARLSPEQEAVIAFIIQNGHSYAGVGELTWGGVTEAAAWRGTNERAALQTLVWCVSDPGWADDDLLATCEDNMSADEQARLLALIPETPALTLQLESSDTSLDVAEIAEFRITTNLFEQPIVIESSGTASVTLSVCSGDAAFQDGVLTVLGAEPAVPVEVVLCATATTAGTLTMTARGTPPATSHIGWSQSVNAELEQPCQVYATFHEVLAETVEDAATVRFVVAPTPGPSPTDDPELAESGAVLHPMPLLIGFGLLGVGGAAALVGLYLARRASRDRDDHRV